LSLINPQDLSAAKQWLTQIGADMSTLQIMPTGDAIEVEWPKGAGRTQAPKITDRGFADYIVLKGATDNHLTSDLFKSQRSIDPKPNVSPKTKEKNPLESPQAAMTSRRLDSGMGPVGQKRAYNVPASLKGTNKDNSQMVFGTGTFGYRKAG
jgi:hypothetical protein